MLLDFTFSINLDDYSIKKICLFVVSVSYTHLTLPTNSRV